MTVKTKKKVPITRHPVFPAMVALWFAALFGMGSLLLRAELFESLVQAIRLDRLIPAAAPPLGFTARTLIAGLLASVGGLSGFLFARALGAEKRAASPAPVQAPDRRPSPDSAAEQPLAAASGQPPSDDNDDLARLEAARESNPARRRGLNAQLVVDPFAPPPPSRAPEPAILNIGELTAIEPIDAPSVTAQGAGDPVQVWSPPPVEANAEAAPETGSDHHALAAEHDLPASPMASSAPVEDTAPPRPTAFRPRQGTAAEVLRQAPLDTLGVVELVERFALALSDRRNREEARRAAETEAQAAVSGQSIEPQSERPAEPTQAANGTARPFDFPHETAPPAPHRSVELLNGGNPAAAEAPAEAFPAPMTETAEDGHLRSLDEGGWALPDLEDEIDEAELAETPLAAPGEAAPIESNETDEHEDQAFSSLLAMKPAVRGPALVADSGMGPDDRADANGHATGHTAGPEATEEALRKALATLQRMSGAA